MSAKAVILAAGLGSRLCPLTPFVAKEMLPISGFPAVHYLLRELRLAGVTSVMTVLSEGKRSVRDYLTAEISPKGERACGLSREREELLSGMHFEFAYQKELRGTADAIYLAREFTGEHPLLVLYPDDLLGLDGAEIIGQMLDYSAREDRSVLLLKEVPGDLASQYGVAVIREQGASPFVRVESIVEKPRNYLGDKAYILMGRMVLTPTLMDVIPSLPITDAEGIVPALNEEAKKGRLFAMIYRGKHFDIGSHEGYLAAIITADKG